MGGGLGRRTVGQWCARVSYRLLPDPQFWGCAPPRTGLTRCSNRWNYRWYQFLGENFLGRTTVETTTIPAVRVNTAVNFETRLTVTMLGNLSVRRGRETLQANQLGGPKARQILEILMLHLGTPVSKSMLIDMLWDGEAPLAAISTLESYVSVLRRCLQPGRGKSGALKTTTGGYLIDASMVDLDIKNFDNLLHQASCLPAQQAYACLCEALAMATGPLLGSELLPEWAETERRVHEARVAEAEVQAAALAFELGLLHEATGRARAVLDTDQLNEQAWTILILALEAENNLVAGLRAYERCRSVLGRELGCTPGPVLRDAQCRLLRATSEVDDDFGRAVHALLAVQGLLEGRAGMAEPMAGLQAAGTVISGYLERARLQYN